MSTPPVTVAIPVLNAGPGFVETLDAVRRQAVERPVELLVADSGSTDGSPALARRHGARVFEIPGGTFSHGGTRNLLMERSTGTHVAFLTQDAAPQDDRWLERLLAGFDLADDVALVCGPYVPRPDASHMVRREFAQFFAEMAPNGRPVVHRLGWPPAREPAIGPETFFSDANGCLARWAWERVPFRPAPYAEDQLLARDMLAASYAKVFVPDAAVVHSHHYSTVDQFRRFFDEWRGLREVHGHVHPLAPRAMLGGLRRAVLADRAFRRAEGLPGREPAATLDSLRYHALRTAGAALGSRADRLSPRVRGWCSLEGRATFEPAAFAQAPPVLAGGDAVGAAPASGG